ncbi:MAG: hypothetical protein LDL26_06760 [Caenispirillum bisanense]|nr:hypothetical protein [Caenispirillum bisanense]MCA1973300.1 hypothetical protein [Caenispirillum sp.]
MPTKSMRDRTPPRLSGKGQDRVEDRLERRAQALRANLLKRKEQIRAREAAAKDPEDSGPAGGDE